MNHYIYYHIDKMKKSLYSVNNFLANKSQNHQSENLTSHSINFLNFLSMKPTSTFTLFQNRNVAKSAMYMIAFAFTLLNTIFIEQVSAQNAKPGCDKYTMLVGDLFDNGNQPQVEVFQFSFNGGVSSCKLPNIGGEGIAVDPLKNIAYIANTSSVIKVYDYSTATFKNDISIGTSESALDVSISNDGNFLFVSTYTGFYKYSTSTGALVASIPKANTNNPGTPSLWGSAVDPISNKVYYGTTWQWDAGIQSTIESIDQSLTGAKTTIYSTTAYSIRSVNVDASGNVWAVMFGRYFNNNTSKPNQDRVIKLSPTGTLLATYIFPSEVDPFDSAFGPDGNLYVTSYKGACVYKLNISTGQYTTHIPAQAGTFGKAIAFVCGNFKCPCTFPVAGTGSSSKGTCNNGTPNNNASITFNNIQWANAADIKEGSSYGSLPLYGAGSNKTGFGTTLTFNNLKHNTQYTIRFFNGSDNCFTDATFTTANINCVCNPAPITLGTLSKTCDIQNTEAFNISISDFDSISDCHSH